MVIILVGNSRPLTPSPLVVETRVGTGTHFGGGHSEGNSRAVPQHREVFGAKARMEINGGGKRGWDSEGRKGTIQSEIVTEWEAGSDLCKLNLKTPHRHDIQKFEIVEGIFHK